MWRIIQRVADGFVIDERDVYLTSEDGDVFVVEARLRSERNPDATVTTKARKHEEEINDLPRDPSSLRAFVVQVLTHWQPTDSMNT